MGNRCPFLDGYSAMNFVREHEQRWLWITRVLIVVFGGESLNNDVRGEHVWEDFGGMTTLCIGWDYQLDCMFDVHTYIYTGLPLKNMANPVKWDMPPCVIELIHCSKSKVSVTSKRELSNFQDNCQNWRSMTSIFFGVNYQVIKKWNLCI